MTPRTRRRSSVHACSVFAAACALTAAGASAHAQSPADVTMQGMGALPALSLDPDTMPRVEGTRVPGAGNWNVGAVLQLLERPLTGRYPGSTDSFGLVNWQFWTDFIVQLGVSPHLAIGLDVPVLFAQDGNLSPLGVTSTAVVGFGDVRGVFRWTSRAQAGRPAAVPPAVPTPGAAVPAPAGISAATDTAFVGEGPGFGFNLAVSGPSGDPRAFSGTGAWIVHPTFVVDFRLFGLILAAQVGYRARLDEHWLTQGSTCAQPGSTVMADVSCVGNVPLRDAITWAVGLRLPRGLLGNFAAPYLELAGAFDARNPGSQGSTPVEMGVGLQRIFGDVTGTLGVSSGFTDTPGLARYRVLLALQWAPRFIDEDGDGLRDNNGEDQCVGLAEDRDGYQDSDGCPEDNDNDEIPDAEDRCPTQDEDVDGFQDDDGCPDPDNDNDGVLDAQDRCPNDAMGADPDPARPGCPNGDIDGDGVPNGDDQCPREPAGPHADPQRAGCAAPDGDHDGVPDAQDACPAQPAGDNATAAQQGCPELDRDHDGVLDAQDRCPDQPESLNGVDDDDGCPEAAPPHGPPARGRVRVRIVGAGANGEPGAVQLLERVGFTADDHVDPRSDALIAQLAHGIIATTRVPRRYYTASVATTPASVRGAAAVDAARANRRRDAFIAALRARGVSELMLRPADPTAPPRGRAAPDRGVVLNVVGSAASGSTSAPASGSASAPASGSASAPASGSASAPASGSASAPASGSASAPGE